MSVDETLRSILARVKVVPDGTHEDLGAAHEEHRRRRYLVLTCGLPDKETERLMGHEPVESTASMVAARSFLQEAKRSRERKILVLAGPPGVGKTTAAAWLLAQGAPRPYMLADVPACRDPRLGSSWPHDLHPRFVPAGELAGQLWPADYRDTKTPALLRSCSMLALDDLGMEVLGDKSSGELAQRLDALLDARYRQNVWTVITTNLTDVEFKDRYGERIVSRLLEVGDFHLVPGKSLR
jgi:DNA replication protein DnaC